MHTTSVTRAALVALLWTTLALVADAPRAHAGTATPAARWEFLASSGAVVPAGEQREALAGGSLSTLQLAFVPRAPFALTATLGWARGRDLAVTGRPRLDLFSYDLGAEWRFRTLAPGRAFALRPFAGAGAGARSYRHRSGALPASHAFAAYAAGGAELGSGRARLRLEARDYAIRFEPIVGDGGTHLRTEVALLAGLRLVSR